MRAAGAALVFVEEVVDQVRGQHDQVREEQTGSQE
jgi:hypothetical protein